LLAREIGTESGHNQRGHLGKALQYATALALGAILFLGITGSLIAAGGESFLEGVTFTSAAGRIIRIAIGLLLVTLGLVQLGVLRAPFHLVARLARPLLVSQAQARRRVPAVGFVIFGFAYVLAGFG
jgi:cytochrome c biogenesis protein CcdA